MNVKTLPEQFFKKGSFYQQVKRTGDIAIFSQAYSAVSPKIGFDVVRVQKYASNRFRAKNSQLLCKEWDFIETYPVSEQWGQQAFSFDNFDAAIKKYDALQEKYSVSVLNSAA